MIVCFSSLSPTSIQLEKKHLLGLLFAAYVLADSSSCLAPLTVD